MATTEKYILNPQQMTLIYQNIHLGCQSKNYIMTDISFGSMYKRLVFIILSWSYLFLLFIKQFKMYNTIKCDMPLYSALWFIAKNLEMN